MITEEMKREYSDFIRSYPESRCLTITMSNRIFEECKHRELKRIAKEFSPIQELEEDLLKELIEFYKT